MGTEEGKSGWWLDLETFQSLGIDAESVMAVLGASLRTGTAAAGGDGGCGLRRRQCLDFIASHTAAVLEAANFVSAPAAAVLALLELDVLTAGELSLWRNVFSWALLRADALTDCPAWWTPPERARILPLLRPALRPGRLRALDLDPVVFAKEIEQTGALGEEELIFKYRFEALKTEIRGYLDGDEREAVAAVLEDHYGARDAVGKYGINEVMKRVRRKATILESEHPHEAGADGQDTRVVEGQKWAQQMMAEFDPRTEIAPTAKLCFHYKLQNGEDGCMHYASLFRHQASPLKTVIIPAPRIVVSFSSDADCKPGWGYRIRFTPVPLSSDSVNPQTFIGPRRHQ